MKINNNEGAPRAVLLTDLSGLGNCSGAANIAILSHFGVEPCLIPTAVLSAQTGFEEYSYTPLDQGFESACRSLVKLSPSVQAVYIGFMTSVRQLNAAAELAAYFKEKGARVVLDPITGDGGARFSFISDELFSGISELARTADVITPNITEFCLLSGADYASLKNLSDIDRIDKIKALCSEYIGGTDKTVIVTGVKNGRNIANIVASRSGAQVVSSRRFGGSISGTGDIFTSFVCAALAKGESVVNAAASAAQFISYAAEKSLDMSRNRNYGLPFQLYLSEYLRYRES